MADESFKERYYRLLRAYAAKPEEVHLAAAAELGRELVLANVPPEEIGETHAEALARLAGESPDWLLSQAASAISAPLMELLMAFGLAFREMVEERQRAEEARQKTREALESKVERQLLKGRSPYGLTFRELTVLHLLAAGMKDKKIAAELGIRPLTASKHVANVLSKMNVSSRAEAGVRAIREELID